MSELARAARAARPPLTLALDAATYAGTVAVLAGREVVAEREAAMRGEREDRLMPAVADALRGAGATAADVGAVVCGGGPGSFTSLRIAASIAKGIAMGRGVPLYTVSSLWLVIAGVRPALAPGEYLAVLDAMRGEWFAAQVRVDSGGGIVQNGRWTLLTAAELEVRAAGGVRVLGPGGFGGVGPHARGVARGSTTDGAPGGRVELDLWEPEYGRKAEAQVRWEAAHGRPLALG